MRPIQYMLLFRLSRRPGCYYSYKCAYRFSGEREYVSDVIVVRDVAVILLFFFLISLPLQERTDTGVTLPNASF